MKNILILIAIWSFNALNLCHGAVAPLKSDICENSTVYKHNHTDYALDYFRRLAFQIVYKQTSDDFNATLRFAEIYDKKDFKVDFFLGIFYALNETEHTDKLFHAIVLYNKIEEFININSTGLCQDRLNALEHIRQELLWNMIITKGSELLVSAVNNHSTSLDDTVAGKFLDILHTANKTLSSRTLRQMVAKVRLLLPAKDLTPILANLSKYTEQNVQFLLALYDDEKTQKEEKLSINRYLQQLKLKTDYESSVAEEDKLKIDAIISKLTR